MFDNKQGVTNIVMRGRTHLWCPLGNDWYTANVTMEVDGPGTIPDYIDVTRKLEEMDGAHFIIEDAAHDLAVFVRGQVGPGARVVVTIDVDDARHVPVTVEVMG